MLFIQCATHCKKSHKIQILTNISVWIFKSLKVISLNNPITTTKLKQRCDDVAIPQQRYFNVISIFCCVESQYSTGKLRIQKKGSQFLDWDYKFFRQLARNSIKRTDLDHVCKIAADISSEDILQCKIKRHFVSLFFYHFTRVHTWITLEYLRDK